MSQTASASDKSGKQSSSSLVPPDERFWQRYSPHAEFPLSSAGSFVLHVLALGLLGLMAWLATTLFDHASRQLPVEAVRLSGGGGNPRGQGDGPNTGAPVEVGEKSNEAVADNTLPEDAPAPKIEVNPNSLPKPQFDEPTGRQIQKTEDASRAFANLSQRVGKIRLPGSQTPGYGKGGTGKGGGSGSGEGTGYGSGKGEGLVNPTQREKRVNRWNLSIGSKTESSSSYVAKLHSLGAFLAIPVRENPDGLKPESDYLKGDGFDYMIVRDLLNRPAKLLNQNLMEVLQETGTWRIWVSQDPKHAADIISELRVPVPKLQPKKIHFLALMPASLEQKLLSVELDYLNKKYRGHTEDDIEETEFRINQVRNGKYEPVVVKMKLNK